MKITTRFTRAILIAALTVCVLFDAATAAATNSQTAREAEEEIKKLIVMITCQFPDGETKPGAGIIFGVEPDSLYIATAAHVVLEKAQPAPDVQVKFRWLGKEVKASLLKHIGGPLDLAVLSVAGLKGFGINADTLPLERLGDPSFMQRGEKVYSMGNPGQEKWSVNATPDKISKIENDSLYYESNFISPGHSGGALLNERWEVVGMIVRDMPPHGEAINITRIIDKLKEWGFPVNLRAPSPM